MKLDDITIKVANSNDAKALHFCMKRAYSAYINKFDGLRLPPMDVDYDEEIRLFPVWVAVREDEVVGGLIMTFNQGHASIANVAISPEAQGVGLGRKLINFAENEAITRGYTELKLATHILLEENVSLYKHLGWVETSRDETRVYMKKRM